MRSHLLLGRGVAVRMAGAPVRDSMGAGRMTCMGDTHTVTDCLVCKIFAGEVPGEVVHVTERTVAFRDINAQAPTHVLVVPREHYPNAAALAAGDPQATAELVTTAAAVAAAEGHEDYRLVFNTGEGVGQSVFHAHVHLLAGRAMTWPPG
jgi:histidine triad (HIT) family protein